MNIDTGEVVTGEELAKRPPVERKQFRRVPKRLGADAKRLLAHRPSAHVDIGGDTTLAQWAAKERKKRKHKAKLVKRAKAKQRRRK